MRDAWWESDGPEFADGAVLWVPVLVVLGAALGFGVAGWFLGAAS